MIPKSFIQDLLNRLDIVDVVERYVPLKKAGANYVACCPFHNEKSPSFTVSQTKQFYHCFGCGAHGTAIGFVMEQAGLGFVDAVEELARGAGLEVPHERSAAGEQHQKVAPDLYGVMQTATRYYREQLKQSPRAIDYLKRRGLSGEIAAKFGIGYAPEGWQNLVAAFPDYQSDSLSETGLVIVGDEGKRYDRFRDRIMFPIINVRGQVIGFGGRVLDKGEPKYLNSPETPLFEKGRELYGLFQAQKAIRAAQQVLVVEGYMDVVALAQHGVEYAVATLGTATTPYNVQKLLRMVDHIVFSFDGDKAGQKAAWRALENALPHLQDGKRISFLFLPVEHDPDSFIREFGREAFERRVQEAMPLSTYLLREISAELDLRTPEGRNQLLQRAKPLLSAITAPAAALLLRKEVAALAGVSQAELEALYDIKPVARVAVRAAPQKARRVPPSALRLLLQCLIAQPSLGAQMSGDWQDEGSEAEAISGLLAVLREADFALSGPALTQMFQGTVHEKVLAAVEADMLSWGESFDVEAEFAGLMGKLTEEQRRRQFHALQAKAQGGLASLSDSEREQYLRLLQR
ncbi:DNA primase [Ferrigenium kumadai]|uniref:DNA primase n=1 Tax=Ferrigenium kumadai TaxID=1682490 RepID=A0AAN1T0D9_9PROT|nr:DNA primase [Ferrigenium kumadai]BBJ00299.1 DNA primase [Ferrigenium kumadai]